MFDSNFWSEIASTIKKNRTRTFLTSLSVFWGVLIFIFLIGIGNGLSNAMKNNFASDATNTIWIYQGVTSEPWKGTKPGRRIRFDNHDLEYIKQNFENVALVSGRFWLPYDDISISYKNEFSSYSINAIDPDFEILEHSNVTHGRFINDIDIQDTRKVAVLGQPVVDKLFKDQDPIGEFIKINNAMFRVVGIYEEVNERENRRVYIPRTTAQKIFNGGNDVHNIAIGTGNASPIEVKILEQKIRNYLSRRHVFDPEDKKAIHLNNLLEEYTKTIGVFNAITYTVGFFGIFTVFAGIIGISNIMLITVKDRTKEFGIRKAIGATPLNIILMVVMEAILITAVAGYFGVVIGVGLLTGIDALMDMIIANSPSDQPVMFQDPGINLGVAVIATVALVVSGAIAGLIPAMNAGKVKPVVALRDE